MLQEGCHYRPVSHTRHSSHTACSRWKYSSALLMLGWAAAADLQVYRKSIHGGKTLLSSEDGRHTVRKQPHQQTKSERSLDVKSFNIYVTPATSKMNLPTVIKLHPPTAKPLHLHANMPMRFGRWSDSGDDRAPNSNPNMPQRFGRAWEMTHICAKCHDIQEAPKRGLPQTSGGNIPYWGLLRTLASEQLLNTDLHWPEEFNFAMSSEEVEMEEKPFRG